jgi:S-DNA-T family DNA segregation ATPase FtsK/SpoIIIE
MSRKKKNNNPLDYVSLPEFDLDDQAKRSIAILITIVCGLISLLGLFNLSGHFGSFLSLWLTLIFGWGKWLVPFIFFYWAFILGGFSRRSLGFVDYLGLGLLFFSYQTLFHFFIEQSDWLVSVESGSGGGYVGYYLSRLFSYLFGFWGGVVILFAFLLTALVLVFNTSLSRLIGNESIWAKIFSPFAAFFRQIFSGKQEEDDDEDADESPAVKEEAAVSKEELIAAAREEILGAWQKKELNAKEETVLEAEPLRAVRHDGPKIQEKIVWPKRSIKIDLPIELLNNKTTKAHGGDTEVNTLKIQKTLEKFGIPVEMGETKVGPTVTQYTFRPAEGVKLARITTLNNDLSLALAAHPIRIEAPIPGKSLVGVEVPNKAKAIVGLREILEDDVFRNRKNNLMIALGKDVAGTSWLYDLTRMPHLLVAGATNSGKSVCLNAIIVSLLYQNNPEDLRFIMVDPKRVELPTYNGIPHLLTPVITEVSKTINALKWCLNEMDRRYDILNKAGKKNIQSYNQASSEKLPYIVFIIDELADFMMTAGKDMEAAIIRLAQMSRAIGIHLILATQRPSVDVITGLIKANIPSRIAFSVASVVDSKTILDASGAEKLLGQGDMLFSTAEFAKPKRIQGAYLSDNEINDVVNYIKEKSGPAEYLEGVTDRQKVSGNAGIGLDGTHGDEDELFEEAKNIIIKAGKASTSMLQRRLSIGYGRAAKILDMLEESGIIGPVNGAKPREVLISQDQYESMMNGGLSAAPIHKRSESTAPESYLEDEGGEGLIFSENEASEPEEENEETEEELSLTVEEEEDIINDEDEILEDIREREEDVDEEENSEHEETTESPAESKKNANPLEDDDEMFFSR